MSSRDSGQAAVLMVMVVTVLCVALSGALSLVGDRMNDRVRAQTAADAAALAGLEGGLPAAELLAARHGAVLVGFMQGPGSGRVRVVVRLEDASATAAATDDP